MPPTPLKRILFERDLEHQRFAEQLGITPHWLGRIASGNVKPSTRMRRHIALALGVPEHELFEVDQ